LPDRHGADLIFLLAVAFDYTGGVFMKSRIVKRSISLTLSVWTVLALVGLLSGVLITHLWDRYSQETEAMGFSGIYERYLASQAGFGDDAQAYRAMSRAGMVHEASALEE
jgi:hypothetical protein